MFYSSIFKEISGYLFVEMIVDWSIELVMIIFNESMFWKEKDVGRYQLKNGFVLEIGESSLRYSNRTDRT